MMIFFPTGKFFKCLILVIKDFLRNKIIDCRGSLMFLWKLFFYIFLYKKVMLTYMSTLQIHGWITIFYVCIWNHISLKSIYFLIQKDSVFVIKSFFFVNKYSGQDITLLVLAFGQYIHSVNVTHVTYIILILFILWD